MCRKSAILDGLVALCGYNGNSSGQYRQLSVAYNYTANTYQINTSGNKSQDTSYGSMVVWTGALNPTSANTRFYIKY